MTGHLSSQTIELLAGRRLAPGDLFAATRHLAVCVACRQQASAAAEIPSRALRFQADLQPAAEEIVHLSYEQLEAYADDSLTVQEREVVKQHFASCAPCLQEARELESLRDNLKTCPAVTGVRVARRREGLIERLAGAFRLRPRQLAFLTASLVLIAVVTVLLFRRPAQQQMANRNSNPSSNEANKNAQVAGVNGNGSHDNQEVPKSAGEVAAASPYESIIKQAMETQKLSAPPAIRDLTGKQSKLLGSSENPDRFALFSPVATLIRVGRPKFRWQSLPGAASYSVAIFDSDLNLIEKSTHTAKLSWTPLHQLKRNVVYIWQVTAVKDGREITAPAAPAREARFKILSSERAAALTRASTELAGSHLKLGIVYAHDGLLDDAEQEFRAAIAANQDAAIARKLLQDVRQIRR